MNIIVALQHANTKPSAEPAAAAGPMAALSLARYHLASVALTSAAAIASPTANLHFFTGITLVAGYAHVRTLDAELLGY